MFLQFLRNDKNNSIPAFNNSLKQKGEPWRLHFYGVQSLFASRDITTDGSKVISYHLTMKDGTSTIVDAATWMLTEVSENEPDYSRCTE